MTSPRRWLALGALVSVAVAGFLLLRVEPLAPPSGEPSSPPPDVSPGGSRPSAVRLATADVPATPHDQPSGGRAESDEAAQLAERMAKLVRDLEYTPGLPEPVQQTVKPQPEPWRADPDREGPPPIVEEVTPHRIRTTGGDRVTIRGKNLRVVQVMFGAAPGRLLEASGSEVAVEAPPSAAGPVTIAVTNEDGTWAIAPAPIQCDP